MLKHSYVWYPPPQTHVVTWDGVSLDELNTLLPETSPDAPTAAWSGSNGAVRITSTAGFDEVVLVGDHIVLDGPQIVHPGEETYLPYPQQWNR